MLMLTLTLMLMLTLCVNGPVPFSTVTLSASDTLLFQIQRDVKSHIFMYFRLGWNYVIWEL